MILNGKLYLKLHSLIGWTNNKRSPTWAFRDGERSSTTKIFKITNISKHILGIVFYIKLCANNLLVKINIKRIRKIK